jgi:hypothetical protein
LDNGYRHRSGDYGFSSDYNDDRVYDYDRYDYVK